MSEKSNILCKFYSDEKSCKFGENCRYLHSEAKLSFLDQKQQSGDESTLGQAVSLVDSDTHSDETFDKEENDSLNSISVNNSKLQGGETSLEKTNQKLCSYFAKGWCSFGKQCHFLHEGNPQSGVNFHKKTEKSSSYHKVDASTIQSDVKVLTIEDNKQVDKNQKQSRKKTLCPHFSRTGNCRFGHKCHFLHVKPETSADSGNQSNDVPAKRKQIKEKKEHVKQTKICIFYKRGQCRSGQACKFQHPIDMKRDVGDELDNPSNTQSESGITGEDDSIQRRINGTMTREISRPASLHPNRPVIKPVSHTMSLNRITSSDEQIAKFRQTEIDQLKKRFAKDKLTIVKDDVNGFECRVLFSPSDPDWPFQVKIFELLMSIPPTYPRKMMTITLPEDQDLPETVRRYLEVCVADWVKDRDNLLENSEVFEIVFRPFLRWMDKQLETNVTEALRQMKREMIAKEAGLEFINAAELQQKFKATEQSDNSLEDDSDSTDSREDDAFCQEDNSSSEDGEESDAHLSIDIEAEKKGTEISLKLLQLRDNAATLFFEKAHVVVQCVRCKTRADLLAPAGQINSLQCIKCNQIQLIVFRPSMMHQFSNVMGYLDLDSCTIFDLLLQDSTALVGCIMCSKDSKINGLFPGQVCDTACRHCHQKLRVACDAHHFAQLQPSEVVIDTQKVHNMGVKKIRIRKDPSVQEGKPLPDNGTCKHYKKSYRWFRFPCCGMVYPCDICHEEKSDGHEMLFANRIICGYCCKEQGYSPDKPCVLCLQMTTRGKSTHWEGGQGCRDKTKMSRNDNQKYANLGKTMSKHAQKVKDAKKKTKPRHT